VTADQGVDRPERQRHDLPVAGGAEADAAVASAQLSPAGPQALLDDAPLLAPAPRLRTLRLLVRRPKFVIGAILFGVVVLLAIFAPLVSRYGPDSPDYTELNRNPSSAHIMGTDYLGRDMWARLVWGGRTSLPAGCLIVIMSFGLGVPWGIIAGFGNRVIDDILMRLIDVLLALPGLVLAMSIVAILGPSIRSVIIALGIAGIPGYARVARASTLTTKKLDYVLAARTLGSGPLRIMRVHVLRNIVSPLVILATLNLSGAILAAAALSFLGIGTQLPAADWGTMLSSGFNYMFLSWSQVAFPALIITVTVLGINLMGDTLGEVLNPQLHHQ
jgi:peptide/nickel transport system permease protein